MTAPNQPGEFLRARRSRLRPADVGPVRRPARASRTVRPGIRQLLKTVRPCPAYDAMNLLSMIANGEATPRRLPSPERPQV